MWGRGPTTDISPLKTFINCGNSSMLVFRKKAPIFVTLGSFLEAWILFASLLIPIERNLQTPNSLLLSPFLFCLKKIEPFDSFLIKNPKIGTNHDKTNVMTKDENIISKILFDHFITESSKGFSLKANIGKKS